MNAIYVLRIPNVAEYYKMCVTDYLNVCYWIITWLWLFYKMQKCTKSAMFRFKPEDAKYIWEKLKDAGNFRPQPRGFKQIMSDRNVIIWTAVVLLEVIIRLTIHLIEKIVLHFFIRPIHIANQKNHFLFSTVKKMYCVEHRLKQ